MSEKIDLRGGTDEELEREVLIINKLYNLRSNPNELMAVLAEEYLFTWWQVRQLVLELELG